MDILVYLDAGVAPRSFRHTLKALKEELGHLFRIQKVDHQFFLKSPWEEKTALIVMPGGRDVPYHAHLRGEANRRIQAFVKEGGCYFGICAGAYYGASEVEFEKGEELEVCESRELAFFPGKAIGPVFEKGVFRYDSESGSRNANIQWEGGVCSLYFNGGCYFKKAETYSNVKVIGYYLDLPQAPAAVVECKVGKGKAILSGVHPEYALSHHQEPARKIFWSHLLSSICSST
ncbi:MAG: BPL-N domain-containing protein [Chlamydiales bacterium]